MRLLPLALLSLSLTVQADVYRWVDEQGNVVFSDRSRQGAERVELPEISTYEPPRVDPRAWDADGSAADAAPAYTVTFLQPQPDTTVRDSQGDVAAILQLRPPLRPGHRIVLDLDGGARRVELSEPQHLFTGLDRGTHDLEAWVVDSAGERIGEALALVERFTAMMHGNKDAAKDKSLGDLRALAGVSKFPVRVRCALLGWNALQEALKTGE